MNSFLLAVLAAFLSVVIGAVLADLTRPLAANGCFSDSDCGWRVTSCCPANAGGTWSCVNTKIYQKPVCSDLVLCPQVMVPEPVTGCTCRNLKCMGE